MTVKYALYSKKIKHLTEILHIGRQQLGGNSSVLYDTHRLGVAFHAAKDTESGLTQCPNLTDIRPVHSCAFANKSTMKQVLFQSISFLVKLLFSISSQFCYQQCRRVALHEESVLLLFGIAFAQL